MGLFRNSKSDEHKGSSQKTFRLTIQSTSDVITNSSSSVFCRIESEKNLDTIYAMLSPLFKGSYYDECDLGISFVEDEEFNNFYIDITIPYGMGDSVNAFIQAGLEKILCDIDDVKINYDVDY